MNGRSVGAPPQSPSGSEWSGFSPYNSGPPPSSPGFPPNSRGNLVSPPMSGSSNGGLSMQNGGMNGPRGGPSPPNSIGARSSYGTTMSSSEAKRRQTLHMEDKLSQHYVVLRRYLGQALRDERSGLRPNRARDKLLRLSGVQFQELSTDVYDELLRRQSAQGQQTNGPGQVPPYLLPKQNFHPKRNQARQKLATLPPPRFRDLASDVFFELERRFPHFTGGGIPRNGSPSIGPMSRSGTPNGMRPPRNQSMSGPMSPEDEYGRPTAKQFQSNTIIPNKSTMVEDDDDDLLSDMYGSRRDTQYTTRSMGGSDKDRKALAESEAQIGELQEKVKELEDKLHDKTADLDKLGEEHSTVLDERQQFTELQSDLESKLRSARDFNADLQSEIDKLQQDHEISERDHRSQLDAMSTQAKGSDEWKTRYEALDRSHQQLRSDLSAQEQTTNEVKREASGLLEQMRSLSTRSAQAVEREEQLVTRLQRAETQLLEWKDRYARARTQASKGASSLHVNIQPADANGVRKEGEYISPNGLIRDIHLTKFQVAIDELLRGARGEDPQNVLPLVKHVIIAVRTITLDVEKTPLGTDGAGQRIEQMKAKVSATATNLITAGKNYALSDGMAPISLLDAAASHLALAIIGLARAAKVSPSPDGELDEDDLNSDIADSPADYYSTSRGNTPATSAGGESMYSNGTINESKPQLLTSRVYAAPPSKKPMTNGGSSSSLHAHQVSLSTDPPDSIDEIAPPARRNSNAEALRTFLDSRTSTLLSTLQTLVSSIRTSAAPPDILDAVASLTSTTRQMIQQCHTTHAVPPDTRGGEIVGRLGKLVEQLEERGREGEEVQEEAVWREYVKALPPLGFDIAREVKELGGWVDAEVKGHGGDDFS